MFQAQETRNMMETSRTETQILDAAQSLIQLRGYHAFSYADIAEEVGIRKASIHYYFPGKSDLGREVVIRYRQAIRQHVQLMAAFSDGTEECLRGYAQIFRGIVRDGGRLCLCGALATDLERLPPALQSEVRAFFAENEAWLERVLAEGRDGGELHYLGPAAVQAQNFLAGLMGAMVTARVHNDARRYCAIAHQILAGLGLPVAEWEISDPE
jgi:TetR/AcrR family transcriptional repressor of nem operon